MQSIESMRFVMDGPNALAYEKVGSGPRKLILFHGFGQDASLFARHAEQLSKSHTVFSFDLFYHGRSTRPYATMSKTEWQSIFTAFLEQERLALFEVLGFSLGGRFAILTSHLFDDKITRLILLAPDGIHVSPWYRLALAFRPLFRHLMYHPTHFNSFLNTIERLGMANQALIRFSKKELGGTKDRRRVYASWTYFRKLTLGNGKLRSHFKMTPFDTIVFLGSKDPIIPPDKVVPVLSDLPRMSVNILNSKHHQLIESAFSEIEF